MKEQSAQRLVTQLPQAATPDSSPHASPDANLPLTEQEAVNVRDYIMMAFLTNECQSRTGGANHHPRAGWQGEKLYWEKYPCFTCHQIQGKLVELRWAGFDGCLEAFEPRLDGAVDQESTGL
jgi:hypothetical protein